LNKRIALLVLALPFLVPLLWRVAQPGLAEPAGLVSDGAMGLLLFCLALYLTWLPRILLILLWALFQGGAQELLAAMHRLPSWQDFHYLADPAFVQNSVQGYHLSAPVLSGLLFGSALAASFVRVERPPLRLFFVGFALFGGLLSAQALLSRQHVGASIAARYNPLHWLVADAIVTPSPARLADLPMDSLPENLRTLDLSGASLLVGNGRAKNVLLVVLEGMPGLYYPEIREAMGVKSSPFDLKGLVANTKDAMLVPDFVAHSHQTIRGLYSILCGDFSKFSYEMSKAFEVMSNPERAGQCLPAQMAKNGWATHYLQGAGLAFMSKDKVMPAIGFQQVHGSEWFTETDPYPFMWGKTDPVFFRGARQYIDDLRTKAEPWLLTLLTVGTHQPYAAPDEVVAKYPNRMIATSAILDEAVADFLAGLRKDGVLDDTLVILTSDESHGDEMADWMSSWGTMAILAPEREAMPRLKSGSYGLVDITASVLDYVGIKPPAAIIGRSLFRDYSTPRDMISFTTNKLRWHTADNRRFECSIDNECVVSQAPSLIGYPPADVARDSDNHAPQLLAMARTLDHKVASRERVQVLEFARSKVVELPETLVNEWTDNLAGAQYLSFPAGSKVHVSVRVKALSAPPEGIQLKLTLREFEVEAFGVDAPSFPLLHAGDESHVAFDIENPKARDSFSFHLTGAGKGASIQLEEFSVTIDRG
jgi:hypothetical protein